MIVILCIQDIFFYKFFKFLQKSFKNILFKNRGIKGNSSSWKVDGKVSTHEAVNNIVQKFNIQLDNLTQFLPQERVALFTKLTPIEMLAATEEAVLPPEIAKIHQWLIDSQKSQKTSSFLLFFFENFCFFLKNLLKF